MLDQLLRGANASWRWISLDGLLESYDGKLIPLGVIISEEHLNWFKRTYNLIEGS